MSFILQVVVAYSVNTRNRDGTIGARRRNTTKSEKVFTQKNERTVNDRRGIEVDFKAEPKTSLLSSLLSSSGAYFEFATEFCTKHPWQQSDQTNFVVNDPIYNDFKSFVMREQRRGSLKLEDVFDGQHLLEKIQMLSTESSMNDSSQIQTSVANLREKLVQELLVDFDSCGDIIRSQLEQNILARQLPDSEIIGRSLRSDELIREAVRMLENTNRYSDILRSPT